MTTGRKTLLLILSILAIVLLGLFLYFVIDWAFDLAARSEFASDDPAALMPIMSEYFKLLFALALPGAAISLGLMIYYIIHIVNSKTMDTGERVAWIIFMVLFSPLVFIIYWIMRIRPLPEKAADAASQPLSPL